MRNIIADYWEVTSGRAAFDTWHFGCLISEQHLVTSDGQKALYIGYGVLLGS